MRLFLAILTVVNALCASYLFYNVPNMTEEGRNMTVLGVFLAPVALMLWESPKTRKR